MNYHHTQYPLEPDVGSQTFTEDITSMLDQKLRLSPSGPSPYTAHSRGPPTRYATPPNYAAQPVYDYSNANARGLNIMDAPQNEYLPRRAPMPPGPDPAVAGAPPMPRSNVARAPPIPAAPAPVAVPPMPAAPVPAAVPPMPAAPAPAAVPPLAPAGAGGFPSYIPAKQDEWNQSGAAQRVERTTDARGAVVARIVKKGVEDFEFREELGTGSYSTVVAAQDKQTLRQYAIKILDKAHIIKEGKVKYVEIEKNTLNRLGDHPGIIHLYFTFQDRASLFFVLDYAPNGELLQLIKKLGSLDEACARYYTAQLIDAVEYMHSKGVIHRDIKPENILLDYKWRIKITDFGTAKLLDKDRTTGSYPEDTRANSFVGTAEYVSPELLTQKHQGKATDIWAIGCILYQMIAGVPPFQGSTQYLTFQRIVRFQYSIPPGFPYLVRDLLKRVLVGPRRRLTIHELKQQPFFDGQNWSQKSIWGHPPPRLAPYKPSPSSMAPTSNGVSRVAPRHPGGGAPQAVRSKPGTAAPPAASSQRVVPGPRRVNSPSTSSPNSPDLARGPSILSPRQRPSPGQQTSASAAAAALKTQPSRSHGKQPQPSTAYQQNQERLNALKRAVREQRSSSGPGPGPGPGPHQSGTPVHTPPQSRASPVIPQEPLSRGPSGSYRRGSPSAPRKGTPVNTLPELPITQLEGQWANVLTSRHERILRIGRLQVLTGAVGETFDEDDESSSRFARIFNARKKARTVLVTTLGRLIIVGDDRRVRAEIPLGVPQVLLREVTRRNGSSIVIDTYNRTLTIDDPSNGVSGWLDSIELSKRYLSQATAESDRNAHSAATAAAVAVSAKH